MIDLIALVDAEIERLNKAKALLQNTEHVSAKRPGRKRMSAKARAAVSAAQKARWAKWKKDQPTAKAAKASQTTSAK